MDGLISRKDAVSRISDLLMLELKGVRIPTWNEVYNAIGDIPTVDAIPIEPLAVWLAGYHVSPPEYALKETGALDPIDQASTVFTPNQIATAWAYHLRKLMESGLMEE